MLFRSKKVFVDINGRYYFDAHKLIVEKGSTETKLFGQGVHSHHVVIDSPLNVDGIKEAISKGLAESEIVWR